MALGGSNVTASAIDEMSIDDIAAFKLADLRSIQGEIDAAKVLWKAREDGLQAALDIRFGEKARALRLAAGKDTGTVHIDDSDLNVACQLGKKVEWDQPKLEAIWQRITAAGEDPKVYMKIAYSVAEAVYSQWPAKIIEAFKPARSVKPEKPKYVISDKKK